MLKGKHNMFLHWNLAVGREGSHDEGKKQLFHYPKVNFKLKRKNMLEKMKMLFQFMEKI